MHNTFVWDKPLRLWTFKCKWIKISLPKTKVTNYTG